MQEFRNLELSALMDMLSLYTAKYTKMLSDGIPKGDSNACREIILLLQFEIEARKNLHTTSVTQAGINFDPKDQSTSG